VWHNPPRLETLPCRGDCRGCFVPVRVAQRQRGDRPGQQTGATASGASR